MSESSMYPSNFIEALTLLYLQNQDLSGVSPEALVKLFYEVHDEIRAANKHCRNERHAQNSLER